MRFAFPNVVSGVVTPVEIDCRGRLLFSLPERIQSSIALHEVRDAYVALFKMPPAFGPSQYKLSIDSADMSIKGRSAHLAAFLATIYGAATSSVVPDGLRVDEVIWASASLEVHRGRVSIASIKGVREKVDAFLDAIDSRYFLVPARSIEQEKRLSRAGFQVITVAEFVRRSQDANERNRTGKYVVALNSGDVEELLSLLRGAPDGLPDFKSARSFDYRYIGIAALGIALLVGYALYRNVSRSNRGVANSSVSRDQHDQLTRSDAHGNQRDLGSASFRRTEGEDLMRVWYRGVLQFRSTIPQSSFVASYEEPGAPDVGTVVVGSGDGRIRRAVLFGSREIPVFGGREIYRVKLVNGDARAVNAEITDGGVVRLAALGDDAGLLPSCRSYRLVRSDEELTEIGDMCELQMDEHGRDGVIFFSPFSCGQSASVRRALAIRLPAAFPGVETNFFPHIREGFSECQAVFGRSSQSREMYRQVERLALGWSQDSESELYFNNFDGSLRVDSRVMPPPQFLRFGTCERGELRAEHGVFVTSTGEHTEIALRQGRVGMGLDVTVHGACGGLVFPMWPHASHVRIGFWGRNESRTAVNVVVGPSSAHFNELSAVATLQPGLWTQVGLWIPWDAYAGGLELKLSPLVASDGASVVLDEIVVGGGTGPDLNFLGVPSSGLSVEVGDSFSASFHLRSGMEGGSPRIDLFGNNEGETLFRSPLYFQSGLSGGIYHLPANVADGEYRLCAFVWNRASDCVPLSLRRSSVSVDVTR